jgi:hypothetical protein
MQGVNCEPSTIIADINHEKRMRSLFDLSKSWYAIVLFIPVLIMDERFQYFPEFIIFKAAL